MSHDVNRFSSYQTSLGHHVDATLEEFFFNNGIGAIFELFDKSC